MKNAYCIGSLARHLKEVAERIGSLAAGVADAEQYDPSMTEMYQNLLLDEIEHVQILTLEITKAVAETTEPSDANADEAGGSVFGAGELTEKLGRAPIENPVKPEDK